MSLYPVSVVARAFEYKVAMMFVVSTASGSDSHCVTWFIAYLCSVFVRFVHNRSVLLVNPEVLREEGDFDLARKK